MATLSHIPARLPVGTRYVIEGRPGKSGKMRIISRQLILPNGQQFDLGKVEMSESFERPRAGRLKNNRRQLESVAKKAPVAKKQRSKA